ncbi:SIMPL domain-containing protein [Glaciecola sp. SC05]|uniref:SIMPL domain-containing protein n=1 Tax=Glaciecola sp. SC05 TaxID=1987355 RepID=UPI003527F893
MDKYGFKTLLVISALLVSMFADSQTIRTLAVTGHAEQQLTPDAFNLNFTFEEKGADLVSIKNAVDKQVAQATALLIDNNVLESNIRSMDVTVYPWVENDQRQRINKGFVYRRTVYFMHTDIDAFDAIIKKVAALSPQQIGQLALVNQNVDKLQRALIQAALKDAKDKADEMASAMGMEVGHVLFMSDGTSPPEHMFERKGRMLMAESADSFSSMPGENTITTKVEVVFEVHTVSSRPQN